jgi:hypothetical protein
LLLVRRWRSGGPEGDTQVVDDLVYDLVVGDESDQLAGSAHPEWDQNRKDFVREVGKKRIGKLLCLGCGVGGGVKGGCFLQSLARGLDARVSAPNKLVRARSPMDEKPDDKGEFRIHIDGALLHVDPPKEEKAPPAEEEKQGAQMEAGVLSSGSAPIKAETASWGEIKARFHGEASTKESRRGANILIASPARQ